MEITIKYHTPHTQTNIHPAKAWILSIVRATNLRNRAAYLHLQYTFAMNSSEHLNEIDLYSAAITLIVRVTAYLGLYKFLYLLFYTEKVGS